MQENGSKETGDDIIATTTISNKDDVLVIDLTNKQNKIRNQL